jgi:excisionase family DNA binding protein
MSAAELLDALVELLAQSSLADRIADAVAQRLARQAAAPDPSEHLSEKAAAKLLGVSPRTLEGWRREGTGPAWRPVGRRIRYSRAALAEFQVVLKRSHKQKTAPAAGYGRGGRSGNQLRPNGATKP